MPSFVLDKCLGAIETVEPARVPDGYAVSATNVELSAWSAMVPRAGTEALSMTSGPTGSIYNMFSERTTIGSDVLWTFSGNPLQVHKWSGAWTSTAISDTPALGANNYPQAVACAYNGKVFLAYNSDKNRLHVWDGSSIRRVGLTAPSAPTVADTGAGTYAATQRYYKVRMYIVSGSTTVASSELSASVSFTPSGGGTAARITKPTTVDSATHWQVYGSTDDLNYYEIGPKVAVGTTTADDTTTPSNYSTGTIAPEAGLFVPPPSAKVLATNGERLFMAGSYETSAGSGETTPANRRIWFTRPLGATDAGDDEAITQTTASRYYLDVDNDDGSPISALVSTVDGAIYAFTSSSIWRLIDTGQAESPIRAERVVSGAGATNQNLVTVDTTTNSATIYFASSDGPYRYSANGGLEYLGADVKTEVTTVGSLARWLMQAVGFDPATRRVYWLYYGGNVNSNGRARVLNPAMMSRVDGQLRGGWSIDDYFAAYTGQQFCCAVYNGKLHIGNDEPKIYVRSATATTDNGTSYTATLQSKTWMLGDGSTNWRTEEPYIWKPKALSVALTLSPNYGGSTYQISDTAGSVSVGGGEASWHRQKVEGLVVADASTLDVTLSVASPVITASRHRDGVERLVIPVIGGSERG